MTDHKTQSNSQAVSVISIAAYWIVSWIEQFFTKFARSHQRVIIVANHDDYAQALTAAVGGPRKHHAHIIKDTVGD